MTVTNVQRDLEGLTMTVTVELDAPIGRAWQLWEDPRHLAFEDGFADDAGKPNPDMPVMVIRVDLHEQPDGRTRMVIETEFPSGEAMDQIIEMGVEEGMTAAVGQIDELLRADTAHS